MIKIVTRFFESSLVACPIQISDLSLAKQCMQYLSDLLGSIDAMRYLIKETQPKGQEMALQVLRNSNTPYKLQKVRQGLLVDTNDTLTILRISLVAHMVLCEEDRN